MVKISDECWNWFVYLVICGYGWPTVKETYVRKGGKRAGPTEPPTDICPTQATDNLVYSR